jgi:hypothetical protein
MPHNRKISLFERIVIIIFSLFVLMMSIVLILDFIQLSHNPHDYEMIYKDYSSHVSWKAEYIFEGIVIICCCIITLGLSIWRLIKPHRWLQLITNVIYLLIILSLILRYYLWSLNGFDHP